jgi:LPXTG-motif cell wall-anchored protein
MKFKFSKAFAAVALTAAALIAAPAAALAYAPTTFASVSASNIAPGGTVDFSVSAGVFEAGEPVSITVSGENSAGASLAMVGASATYSSTVVGERSAEADGSLAPVTVKFPEDANGVYTIKATSPSVEGGVSATVTVSAVPTDGGTSTQGPLGDAGTIPGDSATQDGTLPATGMDNGALMGAWVGAGALLLAGGVILVAFTVRKNREKADLR